MYGSHLLPLPSDRPARELLLPCLRPAAIGVPGRRPSRADRARALGRGGTGCGQRQLEASTAGSSLAGGSSRIAYKWSFASRCFWAVVDGDCGSLGRCALFTQPATGMDHPRSRRPHWPGYRIAGWLAGIWRQQQHSFCSTILSSSGQPN